MPARERLTPTEQALAYLIGLGILIALASLLLSALGTIEDDDITISLLIVGLAMAVLGIGAWLILVRPWEHFDDLKTPQDAEHTHIEAPPQETAADVALAEAVPIGDAARMGEPESVAPVAVSEEVPPGEPEAAPVPVSKETPPGEPAAPVQPDNLTIIEGIGPKIAQALNRVGIIALRQIAEMTPEQLEETVRAQGVRLVGSTESWPLQAKLAVGGDLTPLEDYKKRITKSLPQDDLTPIEGIGPKVQAALYQAGITTFAQLAESTPAALRAALDAAGLKLIDPSTWAEQAALIARDDLTGFEELKKQLRRGRRK